MTQQAKAMDLNLSSTPAGFTCLDQHETQGLVKYRNQCELNSLNLKDTQDSLAECRKLNGCNVAFWQEKPIVVSIVLTALIIGFAGGVVTSK